MTLLSEINFSPRYFWCIDGNYSQNFAKSGKMYSVELYWIKNLKAVAIV